MTSLRQVKHRLHGLNDIRAIMNSMKSLAYMEIHKLSQIVRAQRYVTGKIEQAAADLIESHPEVLPAADSSARVWIVFGSERGFCGNLNQKLLAKLAMERGSSGKNKEWVFGIGRKLHTVMADDGAGSGQSVLLNGAGVTEEAQAVLDRVVGELRGLHEHTGPPAVSAIYFDSDGIPRLRELLPPFREYRQQYPEHACAALLTVPAPQLFADLVDHYLLASLFEILYESLFNENQHRMQHLGEAVRHLDRKTAQMGHYINALHQEQITEEIEVLLLSAADGQAH